MQHDDLNFMLDLETLATTDEDSNVAILSIGCVQFNPHIGHDQILDELYVNVTLKSNMDAGRRICPKTIEWWMKQSDEARSAFTTDYADDLIDALAKFHDFVRDSVDDAGTMLKHGKLWSHGPTFDEAIIRHAYKHVLERTFPIGFRGSRCNRTIVDISSRQAWAPRKRVGTSHNALADAKFQAQNVIDLYSELGI